MGSIHFQPFPVLTTDRLILRRLVLTDADGIFALRSDLDVIKYTGIKQYTSIDEANAYIGRIDRDLELNKSIMWSIALEASKSFIGSICYWNIAEDETCAEIGYDLLPAFHGKGFMQEATKAVIRYGFEGMKLDRIVANLCIDNIKSVKILEGKGFTREKVHCDATNTAEPVEMAIYSLERADYMK